MADYNSAVDPEIPVLKGEMLKDFTRYKRAVQAAELSCDSKEAKQALGPKLRRNLLGADNSIRVLTEQTNPKDYATEDGAQTLLRFLEEQRFAESSFRELPKAFGEFFDQTHFEEKCEEPMATCCTAMGVAKRTLEEVDQTRSWRWANYNDGERDPEDADPNVEHDGYWVQDDDGYWYAWDVKYGVYAFAENGDAGWDSSGLFHIDTDVYLAGEGDEHRQALVTPRESRLKMNKIRAAQGGNGGKGKGGSNGKSKDARPASKGFKGRGKTSKAQSRPRRLGLWAMTSPACVMQDTFHQKGAQDQELATEKFQEPAEYDIMMVSAESDPILRTWRGRLGKIAAELEKYGPRPIIAEASQKFKGLGGDGQRADFQELGVHGKELVELQGGHAGIDIFDYDLESREAEPLFDEFRIAVENVEPEAFLVAETLQESKQDLKVKDDADRRVQEAMKNGTKGIFKKGTLKRIDKLMKEYAVMFDVLRDNNETFLWKLFAKEGMGDRVGDLIQVPIVDLLSRRGNMPPLYETVTLRQCMHGFVDNYGDPIRKPTCVMAPEGSSFPGWLERRCDGGHKRADMVGRSSALAQAGAWPDDLGKALAGAGAHELARRTSPKEIGIGSGAARSPSKQIVNAVATAFKLWKDLTDATALTGDEEVPHPRGKVRRICAMYSNEDVLADYSDAYAGDLGFATIKLAKRFPTDTVVAAYVKAPKVQAPFPASVHIYGGQPKAFAPGDREADTAHRDLQHEGESFGDKPSDITTAQWGALKKLHLNLSHPSAHALKRRLKSYGELGRPTTVRSSNLKLSTEFNENAFLDEAEVTLADGARLMVMVILDDASGSRFIIPTTAVRSITGEESARCFSQGWLSWAGPPKVLHYDAATGRVAKRFAETGEKCTILMRPVPAEAPQLKGRVERAIDFFKDHSQRLSHDVQLTKNDDPHAWTSVIARTCNNQIRRNGFTPYKYVPGRSPGILASLIEAMEGEQRQLASQSAALFEEGPRRAGQIRAAANRAFFELDSDGAVRRAMVGRVRPPRGPFAPGQLVFYWREVKHAKSKRLQGEHGWRGTAIALATEGHTRLHLSYRDAGACATRIPERGARRTRITRTRMNLHPETYPKCRPYREEDQLLQIKLQTHLLRQLGRGTPWAWMRRLGQVPRISGNSNQALKGSPMRLPKVSDDPMDQEALFAKVRNRRRGALLSKKTDTTTKQGTPKKGRKIRSTPQEWKAAFDASDLEEWRKWVGCDAVDRPTEEKLAGVDKTAILPMRRVRTDKNEATRGNLTYEQHPLKAKSRYIVLGCKDEQLLAGELQTNAPALTDTATAVILQEAASQSGWRLEQGDVNSAFLNGKYLDSSRREYFRAPKGGLPAVPEMGWAAVPGGTVLRAKKGIYGLNAPFIFHDENEKLIGVIGTHVDDDLVAGSPEFFANQVAKPRKMRCRGKWQTAKTGLHTCGRFLKQSNDGTVACSQRECTESIGKDKEAKATPEERAMLHSGKGQIQWLVRSAGMDSAFRLVESQARAHDSDLEVQDLLDFNKLVSDAKTDHVDIAFQKISMDDAIVVAVGDSSHGNVGKTKTASQAGLVILLADNKDDQFLRGWPANITPMLWRSHRIKRVARSAVAAETTAALEAVESGDMLRQNLVELHYGLGYQTRMDDVKAIKMVEVTGCRSLYDLLQKRGTVPSEKRRLIEIESLRNDLEFNNVVSKWVSTKQMLADCLTKHDVRAGDYMRYVLQTGECRLTEDLMADQIIAKQKMELKGRRGEYYRSKYPKRPRPADQLFVHEGYTYFEDCIADVRYTARAAQPAPMPYLCWRMMLGQREDDVYNEKLEGKVDWSGLDQVTKRRRIPTHVRKLVTIYAPTKAVRERYEKDFTEKRTIKKPKVTDDDDPQGLGATEELGAHVESDENVKMYSTDVAEIYMMDAAGAESEEIKSGAAAAATVTVCALCRMTLDQCDCGPKTRKKPHRAFTSARSDDLPAVPEDEDDDEEAGTWQKVPTKKEILKARALHDRTGHASYEKIADESGDVIENGVLQAYELVVKTCDECSRGKKAHASMQRGAKGSEFETYESTSKAKGKLKGKQFA
ncbi:unnamed protein product [Prorocentrum cordatum]|uniref:Integrase catalytic domain-containing protein n=1 Tax=Prorocentrum cordatum TaxID=2364126 RepID=A0ABN9QI85_9DINO|nr:unnamed protein product [Polarella glacialis]